MYNNNEKNMFKKNMKLQIQKQHLPELPWSRKLSPVLRAPIQVTGEKAFLLSQSSGRSKITL